MFIWMTWWMPDLCLPLHGWFVWVRRAPSHHLELGTATACCHVHFNYRDKISNHKKKNQSSKMKRASKNRAPQYHRPRGSFRDSRTDLQCCRFCQRELCLLGDSTDKILQCCRFLSTQRTVLWDVRRFTNLNTTLVRVRAMRHSIRRERSQQKYSTRGQKKTMETMGQVFRIKD